MRFFFPRVNAFRLFCLCLSQVILVGMLHSLSGLEGGTIVEVDMLLYNFKEAFVYFSLIFGDTLVIYSNNSQFYLP